MRALLLLATATALTACGGGNRISVATERLDRALAGTAQPSEVVSADIALARAMRKDGAAKAASRAAADNALVHSPDGLKPATQAYQNDNREFREWDPKTVVMSCDGQLAISQGRYRDGQGLFGTYLIVWEQQRDRTYRWTYRVLGEDNPQPASEPITDDAAIVVTGIDAVKGLVAECPVGRTAIPAAPAVSINGDRQGGGVSKDGSLRWRWVQDGQTREVAVDYYSGGQWVVALDEVFAGPTGAALF